MKLCWNTGFLQTTEVKQWWTGSVVKWMTTISSVSSLISMNQKKQNWLNSTRIVAKKWGKTKTFREGCDERRGNVCEVYCTLFCGAVFNAAQSWERTPPQERTLKHAASKREWEVELRWMTDFQSCLIKTTCFSNFPCIYTKKTTTSINIFLYNFSLAASVLI